MAPLRISFAGGGTDFPEHYTKHGGRVISSAVNQYVYVMVGRREEGLFRERYRLSYFEAESVSSVDEIRNDTARECLKLVPVASPLHISTSSDLPASSGLGSSSSFATALLLALHRIRGEDVGPAQLAEEACEVEIQRLRLPIGKQDQYAAAYGGLNLIRFERSGRVVVQRLEVGDNQIQDLFNCIALVWTGIQRSSSSVLSEQKELVSKNQQPLNELNDLAGQALAAFADGGHIAEKLGTVIKRSWELKQTLASKVSDPRIQELIRDIQESTVWGSKVCGAGGGGFVLVIAPPASIVDIASRLPSYRIIRPNSEPLGARIFALV